MIKFLLPIIAWGLGYLLGRKRKVIKQKIRFWLYRYRIKKAATKWDSAADQAYIKKCIKEDESMIPENPEPGESYTLHRSFYWSQLVWQEIDMYARLGEQVDLEEFTSLCTRRGFTLNEQNYLYDMLKYIGLIK